MKSLIVAVLILSTNASFADIISNDSHETKRIKVDFMVQPTTYKRMIGFQLCDESTKVCKTLGNSRFLPLEEIKEQRADEKFEVAYSSVGAVVGIVSLAKVSEAFGLLAIGGACLFDPINPFVQHQQAKLVSEEILDGFDVYVDDVEKAAKRLDVVLKKAYKRVVRDRV